MTARTGYSAGDSFAMVASTIEAHRWRPEVRVTPMPSPQRIAPHSVALGADVVSTGADSAGDDLGTGRLVLLHDPDGNEAWQGTYRCVTFARASVDLEMVSDPYLADVGWSWLTDALDQHRAAYTAAAGTVTAVSSRSFGEMGGEPDRGEVEIRASWTPLLDGAASVVPHLAAWQDLLCMTAGLPPLPDGVVLLTPRQGSQRM